MKNSRQIVALPAMPDRPMVVSFPWTGEASGPEPLMHVDQLVRQALARRPRLSWMDMARFLSENGMTVLGGIAAREDAIPERWLYRCWDESASGAKSFLVLFPIDNGNELAGRQALATNRPDMYAEGLFGRQTHYVLILDTGEIVLPGDQVWNSEGELVPAGPVTVPRAQFHEEPSHAEAVRDLKEHGFTVIDEEVHL